MSWSGASAGMADDIVAIIGPTASGKTALAIEVAARIDGEVISMDSRQVYRGMSIGTAKPSANDLLGIVHYGFDIVGPDERFNAGRFAALARGWIAQIRERRRIPILAGGTGFFLRALTHPMFDEPPLDPELKEQWKQALAEFPPAELGRWAAALDPAAGTRSGDRQRLARAIEIAVLTGRPLSWWQRSAPANAPAIDPRVFVLDLPRDVLYRRIEERVDTMIRAGLAREVQDLMERGYERSPGMNATGYIEMVPHIRGERTLEEAAALIKAATRRYARRQVTWLRHQLPPGAVRLDAREPMNRLADDIVRQLQENT